MRILKRYEVCVFEDGSITTKEIKEENTENNDIQINLKNCSSRIGQVITVLALAYREQKGKNPIYTDESITKAIKETAVIYNTSTQTINDKLTRQLKMENAEGEMEGIALSVFRSFARSFITGEKENDFYMLLENNASSRKDGEADKNILKLFWENPEQEMLFADGKIR